MVYVQRACPLRTALECCPAAKPEHRCAGRGSAVSADMRMSRKLAWSHGDRTRFQGHSAAEGISLQVREAQALRTWDAMPLDGVRDI